MVVVVAIMMVREAISAALLRAQATIARLKFGNSYSFEKTRDVGAHLFYVTFPSRSLSHTHTHTYTHKRTYDFSLYPRWAMSGWKLPFFQNKLANEKVIFPQPDREFFLFFSFFQNSKKQFCWRWAGHIFSRSRNPLLSHRKRHKHQHFGFCSGSNAPARDLAQRSERLVCDLFAFKAA